MLHPGVLTHSASPPTNELQELLDRLQEDEDHHESIADPTRGASFTTYLWEFLAIQIRLKDNKIDTRSRAALRSLIKKRLQDIEGELVWYSRDAVDAERERQKWTQCAKLLR